MIKNGKVQYAKISLLTVLMSIVFARISVFIEIQNLLFTHIDGVLLSISFILSFIQMILLIISQMVITIDYMFNVRYVKKIWIVTLKKEKSITTYRVSHTLSFNCFSMAMRC